MDKSKINKELELLGLKNKLMITLKYYLFNTHQTGLSCFHKILDLLKLKYDNAKDFEFIEQGIRCSIQNNKNNLTNAISNISSYIINYDNWYLLEDLLNSIDIGINYRLEYNHNNLEKLIIENTNLTAETGNEVVLMREDIKSLI